MRIPRWLVALLLVLVTVGVGSASTPFGDMAPSTPIYTAAEVDTLLGGKVATTRSISTTAPLSGGGDLSADRTLSLLDDGVTNAKLANVATATFKGRTTAGTGDPEDLTAAQATALLNVFVGDSGSGGTKGLVPAPAAGDAAAGKFAKADGTWAVPSGSGAPADATYVVTSAHAGLSAEVVIAPSAGVHGGSASGSYLLFHPGEFGGRLARTSTTAIELAAYRSSEIEVNGKAVDITTPLTLSVSDNLLSSTATDSGGNMAPSTLYYVYVSNSSPSFAATDLRGSATAPTFTNAHPRVGYYLGTTGDTVHWRFCGWLRTNATGTDGEVEDNTTNRLVVNYYNRRTVPVWLTPGYSDNNAATAYTTTSTSFTPANAGTGATGSYVANGEDAVHLQAFATCATSATATFLGIGDNSTTQAIVSGEMDSTVDFNMHLSYSSVPAVGYRTVSLLVAVQSGTGTFRADNQRQGSAADPVATALLALVQQ